MPSFDIEAKPDLQKIDNLVNVVKREIENRYDFKSYQTTLELDKKEKMIRIETDYPIGIKQIEEILLTRAARQGVNVYSFDLSREAYPSGKMMKKEIPIIQGIEREKAKEIVKLIKDTGLKVQTQIMDDMLRVTGKNIDDLQTIIQTLKACQDIKLPLEFTNFKR